MRNEFVSEQRTPKPHPLTGIRVVELGNYIAGPVCGMLLADLGAEVIKVEHPAGGDLTRQTGPFVHGESAGFMALNRNKKSIAVDLKSARGTSAFLALVGTADVILENFRPGTMERLGFGYEALRRQNPRLIYCSTSGFGQSGPYSQRTALDLIIQAMSGLMSVTGEPGRPPVKAGVPIADLTAGLYSACAVLAALLARDATGEGQSIDISMLEAAASLEIWETSGYFATNDVPGPLGSAHRTVAPYQAFRTADGYVTVGATATRMWEAFCSALGIEELSHDPRFTLVAERHARASELARLIEEVTTTRPSRHWYAVLEAAGVPCGVLNNVGEVVEDPQLLHRGFFVQLPHSTVGSIKTTGSPFRFSETPVRLDRAGPTLGEHTLEVLSSLGISSFEAPAPMAPNDDST
jgi:crotonobetainyl-CoA:carnitine CoA-transferase CaiB-like acyl-CoA transferase